MERKLRFFNKIASRFVTITSISADDYAKYAFDLSRSLILGAALYMTLTENPSVNALWLFLSGIWFFLFGTIINYIKHNKE